ncbi:holo-ACP synthase [Gordonibacter massiliensis (ex Traore et al. 2017)]|uniref:holo-ACP synthase n=1 Tax=Gordonibacter massiliensis (ex Traore et al. 2017) TaxID=1841863 RepID=UPI001C8BB492|nr:holo-ACP synthase [Gordonibacter massiliensis (ex Traore et al. 2017)]MBX9034930.1 holo-[acyl-carrier-protein] synthase [Gordonibacter massiliensis (ex Traore et al. 2017)]
MTRSAEPKDLGPGSDVQAGAAEAAQPQVSVRRASAQASATDKVADTFGDALEGQVGLGVDIVEIARMKAILARTPSFATRVFSDEERAYCEGTASPEVHFATRFAAKEAVVKALGTGFSRGIGVRDIEVRRNAKGRPYVVLSGRAKEIAHEQGVRELPISLSFTHAEAVACAMAITEDSLRAAEKRVDPMEELSKQFKEARSMLDEIGEPPAPSAAKTPGSSLDASASSAAGPSAPSAAEVSESAGAAVLSATEAPEPSTESAAKSPSDERPATS